MSFGIEAVQQWFMNSTRGIINTQILILFIKESGTIKEFLKICQNMHFLFTDKLSKNHLENKDTQNIVFIAKKNISIESLGVLRNTNIEVLSLKISRIYGLDTGIQQAYGNYNNYFNFWSGNIDQYNITQAISYTKSFILNFLNYENKNDFTFGKRTVELILFRNRSTLTKERMNQDVEYFEENSILTSRLAIFVYKVCTYDFDSSDKLIGQYFAREFGSSNVYNNKKFKIANTRCYITSNPRDTIEHCTKVKIAKYLLKNNVCNNITISLATGLDIEFVNSI